MWLSRPQSSNGFLTPRPALGPRGRAGARAPRRLRPGGRCRARSPPAEAPPRGRRRRRHRARWCRASASTSTSPASVSARPSRPGRRPRGRSGAGTMTASHSSSEPSRRTTALTVPSSTRSPVTSSASTTVTSSLHPAQEHRLFVHRAVVVDHQPAVTDLPAVAEGAMEHRAAPVVAEAGVRRAPRSPSRWQAQSCGSGPRRRCRGPRRSRRLQCERRPPRHRGSQPCRRARAARVRRRRARRGWRALLAEQPTDVRRRPVALPAPVEAAASAVAPGRARARRSGPATAAADTTHSQLSSIDENLASVQRAGGFSFLTGSAYFDGLVGTTGFSISPQALEQRRTTGRA